jgi:4-hydroxybenzoyl-CoA reductase subunit beta
MRIPYFDFRAPSTLEEALSILDDYHGGAQVLAGGTDLIPLMKYGLDAPGTIMSLKNVTSLSGIKLENKEFHIGAMTSLADLLSSSIIKDNFQALHQAIAAVAAPPIRNVATVGGNICQNSRCFYYNQSKTWRIESPPCLKAGGNICHAVPKGKKCFSVYSGDLAPALIALKSSVSVERKGKCRILTLRDIFSDNGMVPFTLDKEELLTSIIIPLPEKGTYSSYVKMRLRPAVDYPLLSVAVSVSLGGDREIKEATFVLGAVGPAPVVVSASGQLLRDGMNNTDDFDALGEILRKKTQMVDNLALPGSYRRKMLPVMAKKAIQAAIE